MNILNKIQTELVAPKNLNNTFGNYKYRSCEGILEALKPHLITHSATITLNDEMVEIGGRVYVKAVATLKAEDQEFSAQAFAREAENKKGMDAAQVTGAASSYARKYALNGLLAIDDTKQIEGHNPNTDEVLSIDDRQESIIRDLLYASKETEERFCKFYKCQTVELLPAEKFNEAKAKLEAKVKS